MCTSHLCECSGHPGGGGRSRISRRGRRVVSILKTAKQNQSRGGVTPLNPPPPWIRHRGHGGSITCKENTRPIRGVRLSPGAPLADKATCLGTNSPSPIKSDSLELAGNIVKNPVAMVNDHHLLRSLSLITDHNTLVLDLGISREISTLS